VDGQGEETKQKMSGWQAYIDQSLTGTGHVSRGLICGHDGTVWATSPGFNPNVNELRALIGGFTNPGALQGSGIHLEGKKHFTLRVDDQSIYGKLGQGGCAAVKTNQCVILGCYNEGIQPGQCNSAVERLGAYLRDQGY